MRLRPIVHKIILAQVVILIILAIIFHFAGSLSDEEELALRAEEFKNLVADRKFEEVLDTMICLSDLASEGIRLVHLRALLAGYDVTDEIDNEIPPELASKFRGRDLVADLRRRAVEDRLREKKPGNLGIFQILLDTKEPVVTPADLKEPEGEKKAAELARAFFPRYLEEIYRELDRDHMKVSRIEVGLWVKVVAEKSEAPQGEGEDDEEKPAQEDVEEKVFVPTLATIDLEDGRSRETARFVQKKQYYQDEARWYLDLSKWYDR